MKTDVFSIMDPKEQKERDRELVQSVQNGERQRFDELYTTYVDKIYRFVYYRVFDVPTAEDLTSETFLKALKNIDTLREKENFSAWVYRIAYHVIIDHRRTNHPHESLDDEEVPDVSDTYDVARDVEAKDMLEQVRKEVMKLGSPARDVVLMRVWDELSYEEIAEIVGKNKDNCKVIFSRSIREVRGSIPLSGFVLLASYLW